MEHSAMRCFGVECKTHVCEPSGVNAHFWRLDMPPAPTSADVITKSQILLSRALDAAGSY
jgi:hypothetical protein